MERLRLQYNFVENDSPLSQWLKQGAALLLYTKHNTYTFSIVLVREDLACKWILKIVFGYCGEMSKWLVQQQIKTKDKHHEILSIATDGEMIIIDKIIINCVILCDQVDWNLNSTDKHRYW